MRATIGADEGDVRIGPDAGDGGHAVDRRQVEGRRQAFRQARDAVVGTDLAPCRERLALGDARRHGRPEGAERGGDEERHQRHVDRPGRASGATERERRDQAAQASREARHAPHGIWVDAEHDESRGEPGEERDRGEIEVELAGRGGRRGAGGRAGHTPGTNEEHADHGQRHDEAVDHQPPRGRMCGREPRPEEGAQVAGRERSDHGDAGRGGKACHGERHPERQVPGRRGEETGREQPAGERQGDADEERLGERRQDELERARAPFALHDERRPPALGQHDGEEQDGGRRDAGHADPDESQQQEGLALAGEVGVEEGGEPGACLDGDEQVRLEVAERLSQPVQGRDEAGRRRRRDAVGRDRVCVCQGEETRPRAEEGREPLGTDDARAVHGHVADVRRHEAVITGPERVVRLGDGVEADHLADHRRLGTIAADEAGPRALGHVEVVAELDPHRGRGVARHRELDVHRPGDGVLRVLDRRWRVEGSRPRQPPVDELQVIGHAGTGMEHEGAAHRVRRLALDDELPGLAVVRDARSIDDASHLRGQCGAEVPAEAIGHLRELLGSPVELEDLGGREHEVALRVGRTRELVAQRGRGGAHREQRSCGRQEGSRQHGHAQDGERQPIHPQAAQPEGQRGEGRHRVSPPRSAAPTRDPPAAAPAPGSRP